MARDARDRVTIAIHLLLPEKFIVIPRWVLPTALAVMVVPLSIFSPRRVPHESRRRQSCCRDRRRRHLDERLNLVMLAYVIVEQRMKVDGAELVFSSIGIWLTNVIVFALWYWELDRGGPDDRLEDDHREPDLLFPQMVTPGCAKPGWSPQFVDYLYVRSPTQPRSAPPIRCR